MLTSWIITGLLSLTSLSAQSAQAAPEHNTKPNVVIIFTDDQGYSDVGVFGAKGFDTPNLDRLAAEGMRFTNFYAAQPVCSASRAALLTGCYPNRIGIHGALGPSAKHGISKDELTLGELCQHKGYRTALFGKWHLGHLPEFLPIQHGFERYYGIPYSNDMWPFHPDGPKPWKDLPTFDQDKVVAFNGDQRRFTGDFTDRTVDFIAECAEAKQPFLVVLTHPMPHVPLFTSAAFAGSSEQGAYGDVIQEIDHSVGRVLHSLAKHELEEDTLVLFATDNGPWLSYGNHAGSCRPLREGKGTTFEGGVRVPCIVRWPGQVPANSVCDEPAMTIDVLPTIANLIDADLPEHTVDGLDIWPLLSGAADARSPHESFPFYYHKNHLEALRWGNYKLHLPHSYRSMDGRKLGSDGRPGPYDYGKRIELSLFDLSNDIGETTNLVESEPEVLEHMLELVEAWRSELGDELTKRKGSNVRPAGQSKP